MPSRAGLQTVLRLVALCAALPLAWAHCAAAELALLVETSTDMPMADIRDGQLVGGLHRDVGTALASQLGREARFTLLPRKRVVAALESGEADLSCHYLPAWLPGKVDWSLPFMPNGLLLISDQRAPRPERIESLADVPIGTVLGFVYPELERILGPRFQRADAPSATSNLRKLAATHVQHALVGEVFLNYQQSTGQFKTPLHPAIVVQRYEAQCAVSRRGHVGVAEVNHAIEALKRDGQLQRIYARYR